MDDLRMKLIDVVEALPCLASRERAVICDRLIGKTLAEVAGDYGVSKDRVRSIEKKAIGRLRKKLEVIK